MEQKNGFSWALGWWLTGLLLVAGCDQATLPRLSDAPTTDPLLPVAVAMNFDEPLRAAILQYTACADTLWEGQLGKSIVGAFEREARRRYSQAPLNPEAKAGTIPHITVDLRLVEKSFEARTRTGAGEVYTGRLMVRLAATFKDATGRVLTEGPLTYDDNLSISTPTEGSSTRCYTGGLDAAMEKASNELAKKMTLVVAGIAKETGVKALAAGQPASAQGTAPLVLRATLEDGNGNRLLEPGEKVTLRIDATNQGSTPIGSASISLSGSPAIIEAFSATLAGAPLLMGSVPPGETRATFVAGRMPASMRDERIELTLSAVTGEGLSVTPVALVAAAPAASPAVSGDRYAVIVGLSRYRTPWRGSRGFKGSELKKLVGQFRDTLGVPDAHILLLQDELAGRADLEEALVRWLPRRASADAIVFVYFAGHSVSDARTGEVFLLPHDGAPASSRTRWLPLRLLQQRLKSLGAKLSLVVLDTPVTPVGGTSAQKGKAAKRPKQANWAGSLGNATAKDGAGAVIQIVPNRPRDGRLSQAVDGLAGDADINHDGRVTLSEWLRSLRGTALTYPTLPPSPDILAIPLSTRRK